MASIVAAEVPILCVDTCSILDLVRDPTRDKAHPHDRQAAVDLVQRAADGRLVCLMAAQVSVEFVGRELEVREEAERNLAKVRKQVERINQIAAVYGATGLVSLIHWEDHIERAKGVVDEWFRHLVPIDATPETHVRAFGRVNAGRSPAAKGKDSTKDCLIYETYLEAISALRAGGCEQKIVFLSSNTREYLTEGQILKSDIAAELAPFDVTFASGMGHAKHALGL